MTKETQQRNSNVISMNNKLNQKKPSTPVFKSHSLWTKLILVGVIAISGSMIVGIGNQFSQASQLDQKIEQAKAEKEFARPAYKTVSDKERLKDIVRDALFISKIVSYAQGFKLLQAAEKNNAEAQYLLGDAVYTEKEDEKNILYWVEKAAENQHISAILKLANYYVGKKEYDQALYYVKKGVALNHEDALIAMAEFYEYGLGMLQDNEKALTYYKKSNEILKDKWLMDKIKMLEAKIKDKK